MAAYCSNENLINQAQVPDNLLIHPREPQEILANIRYILIAPILPMDYGHEDQHISDNSRGDLVANKRHLSGNLAFIPLKPYV